MPWKSFSENNQHCVYKIDSQGNRVGKSLGCHPTKAKANSQVAALYANESKELTLEIKADIRKPKKTPLGTYIRKRRIALGMSTSDLEKKMTVDESTIAKVETGVISTPGKPMLEQFAKALGVPLKELIGKLPKDKQPAERIAPGGRPVGKEITDTLLETEIETYDKEIDEDETKMMVESAYTPTYGATSFEELEAVEEAEEKAARLRKDSAIFPRLLQNIFYKDDGDKVGMATKLIDELKSRVNNALSGNDDKEITEKELSDSSFMVFKTKSGEYRFVTTYSNNIRDDDNPPEIISSKSHERFEELVDKGKVPLPEVWLWHMKELVIGQTDVIAYDKENGVAIAAGHFFKESTPIAEKIYENQDQWGVSHGMPVNSIVRNKEDSTIIEQHITKEISPLPKYAAANPWADFTILKENDMTISDKKKGDLKNFGISSEMLENIQSRSKNISDTADELKLERKEADAETPAEETPVDKVSAEETPAEAPAETPAKEEEAPKEKAEPTTVFSKEQTVELAEAFKTLSENIVETVMESVKKELAPITEKLDAKEKSLDEEFKSRLETTPKHSLAALIFGDAQKSATEDPATLVDGRTSEGKDGPTETKEETDTLVKSQNPVFNVLATRILNNTLAEELKPDKEPA